MTDWIEGTVLKVKFWTDSLLSLIIHAPVYSFIAGQFTKLGMIINGERIQRAYSYVNAPNNPALEFYLVVVPNGKLSPHLATLKKGDKIQIVRKASGFFVLNEIPSCETLWMFATGTAIGPYISILDFGKDLERFKNIVLVHAVRYRTDLSYLKKMLDLKNHFNGKLRIQTIISREKSDGSLKGHIPNLIEDGSLEKSVNLLLNVETSHVMLCGNPNMVKDTKKILKETRKMDKHLRRRPGHVTEEHYW